MQNSSPQPGPESRAVIGLHPRILRAATFPEFDLLMLRPGASEPEVFRRADEPVYANTWQKLERTGCDRLLVAERDRDDCMDYVERNLGSILSDDSVPAREKAEWVYHLSCRALRELFEDLASYDRHKQMAALTRALVEVLTAGKGVEWHLRDCAVQPGSLSTHSVNVAALLVGFIRDALGVQDRGLLFEVALGGLLHDAGKTTIPDSILEKPEELTDEEFAQVRRHPPEGLSICRPALKNRKTSRIIVRQHHEDLCGSGYPDGRAGDAIHIVARAARVMDAFDALTAERPHRPALDDYAALNTMATEMRQKLDRVLLRRFIRRAGDRPDPVPSVVGLTRPASPARERREPEERPEPPASAPVVSRTFRVEPVETPEKSPVEDDEKVLATEDKDEEDTTRILTARAQPEPEGRPLAETHTRAIRELAEEGGDRAEMLAGILGALQEAVDGPLAESVRAEEDPDTQHRPDSAASRSARETEEQMVQSLFPIVWQIDEWEGRFTPIPQQSPETAAACADARSCLRALREDIISVLEAHNVEVREEMPESEDGERQRVGFIYRRRRSGDQPERVVIYPDRRKAG